MATCRLISSLSYSQNLSTSTMSDEGDERRKRLKALKEKASKNIKFRNYRPQDAKLKEKASDSSSSASGDGNKRSNEQDERIRPADDGDKEGEKRRAPTESLIQQELKKQKGAQGEDDLNIAPKKVNWDLKRGAEKKLQKLERRTQRAIVEIIRERMAEEEEDDNEEDNEEDDNEEDSEEDDNEEDSEEDDNEGDSEEDDNGGDSEEDDNEEDSEEDDGED